MSKNPQLWALKHGNGNSEKSPGLYFFWPTILGPEKAAPLLWAHGKIAFFSAKENLHAHKIPRFREGVFWVLGGRGGEAPILFYRREDFSEP